MPRFDPAAWRLRVWGRVETPIELDYGRIRSLPSVEVIADLHCVTGWSALDRRWTGVRASHVLGLAGPLENASHVMAHGEYDYTANLPLDRLRDPGSLLAWGADGDELTPEHGYPLRLVVPSVYGWKSVKWLRGLEILDADRRGFWEVRGYHNDADAWKQERYSYQE